MAAERHPLVACDELAVVELDAVAVSTSELGERRGRVLLRVVEPLLGPRRAGDRIEQVVATAGMYLIHAGNWSPWDFVDLTAGRRFLFAPGGAPSQELRLAGVREVPRILEELPGSPLEAPTESSIDLDEVRALAAIRARPVAERGEALRRWLADARFAHPAWGSAAARELALEDPDEASGIDSLLLVILRDDVTDAVRFDWARTLQDLAPASEAGRRQRLAALWHILDRGRPRESEDERLTLHAALYAFQGLDLSRDPKDVIPDGCSRRRLLEALAPLPGLARSEKRTDRLARAVEFVRRLAD